MENFNKNWLIILLVAVIFGILGFLLGRVTGHNHARMMCRQECGKEKINLEVEVDENDGAEVKTDTIMKDGKQIIIKEIKKRKKE